MMRSRKAIKRLVRRMCRSCRPGKMPWQDALARGAGAWLRGAETVRGSILTLHRRPASTTANNHPRRLSWAAVGFGVSLPIVGPLLEDGL
jgi:hypothetical protein